MSDVIVGANSGFGSGQLFARDVTTWSGPIVLVPDDIHLNDFAGQCRDDGHGEARHDVRGGVWARFT